jgi:predicted dehydrogenase
MEGALPVASVYRVACIGASRMGSWFDDTMRARAATEGGRWLEWIPGSVAAVCQAVEQTELVAVCDLDQALVQQTQARWDIPAGYADFREMIERERPDIVAIVTSWGSTHAEIAAAVAETGLVRGISCEKPIGASMAQADRVVDACRRHGVVFSCSHVGRWNPRYRLAQRWIAEGAIGEVRAITCSAMGNLLHFGTHHTDAMVGLAGDADPEWAFGVVEPPPALPETDWRVADPVGGGYIKLKNGVHLLMEGVSPFPRSYQVTGTAGKICLWNDMQQVQVWRKGEQAGGGLVPGPLQSPPATPSYAWRQMAELIDVLEHGGQTSCNEVGAARALEMALALRLSHDRGGVRVPFPIDDRTLTVDSR